MLDATPNPHTVGRARARSVLATERSWPGVLTVFAGAGIALTAMNAFALESLVLTDPAPVPGQELGYAQAMDGGRFVMGSPGDRGLSGKAHVVDCRALPCAPPVDLSPDDLDQGDLYGAAVAMSGATAVVAAPGQSGGAVYVYVRTGSTWSQQDRLTAPDGAADERFGSSVAVQGDRLVVGADSAESRSGAVYVFVRDGGLWLKPTRLSAPDASPGDRFGAAVSLDGDTLLAGAPFDAGVLPAFASGAAYVYRLVATEWTVQAKLTAPAAANGDLFGMSLDLDGDRALIGAPLASARSGNAHVFERDGTQWLHRSQLSASDGLPGERFGWSVALGNQFALIGAPYWLEGCGSGYLFRPAGAVWTQTAEADISLPLPGNLLGWSVSADGTAWSLGAPGYAGAPDHSGAVYGFAAADPIFASGFESAPPNRGEDGCIAE